MSKKNLLALKEELAEALSSRNRDWGAEEKNLCLEISEAVRKKVDRIMRTQTYSNDIAFSNASVNYLSLYALIEFLQGEPDLCHRSVAVFPGEAELAELLEFCNGIKIVFDGRELILLPMEVDELTTFEIPQEWVDIADFAAEYYIAVQIDPENGWIKFAGGSPYQAIKQRGAYDAGLRAYCLAAENLTSFTSILVAAPSQKPTIHPLPKIFPEQTDRLLSELGKPALCSPRFLAPFHQYAALIADPELRKQLYRRRTQPLPIDVGLWLKDRVGEVARALTWELVPLPATATALRSGATSELEKVLKGLEQESGIVVPTEAKCATLRGEEFAAVPQIYTVVWPVKDSTPEEWVLLVVLKAEPGHPLPVGTKLQIRDETELLVDCEATPDRSRNEISVDISLYGQVCGTRNERFWVVIDLTDGLTIDLPPLTFASEAER